ncbi:hypothetical protein K1T71_011384 [Dendrolimus kikuchii]|uniref:Uncharacterized protein n=1 Tax=Dendrolimus kikuchii TaxID=765133 RepID=A0ACC1CNM7_9NEOP|nr:hypothetical protein K1T71_011384 [Dendrolimus kikuchii]
MLIMKSLCLLLRTLGILVLVCVNGQAQSPCPGTFDYQSDGYNMYGVINIQPNGPVSYVNIKANFTIATQLPTNYYGSLEPLQQNDIERRLARGFPIKYKVNFPVSSPLPVLTSIVANGKLLCHGPGDIPGRNQIVTTINLEHVLTLSSGPGYSPFITDFVVPENLYESGPSYSVSKVPVDPEVLFATVPVAVTTNQARPTPGISIVPPVSTASTKDFTVTQQINADRPEEVTEEDTTVECGVASSGANALIIHGDEYLRGDWPWVVALFKKNKQNLMFICSGTLVSEWHVISAAHCLFLREVVTKTSEVLVKVGAHDLDDVTDDIAKNIYVAKATAHDAYDPNTLKNDIIVLTLQKKVVYNNYIRPVCLWNEDQTDLDQIVKKRGVVAGWGGNEFGEAGRGKPRKASLPVVSWDTCKASREEFHKLTSATTLCAGDRNGTGPCNGDSGGGLYMKERGDKRWKIRGVVSVSLHSDDGEYACNVQQYIVFTDTAKYLSWIKSVMSAT